MRRMVRHVTEKTGPSKSRMECCVAGGSVAVLHGVVREGLPDKVTLEQKLEGRKREAVLEL